MRVLIVADDLTGANDTAVQFRGLGRAVTLFSPEHLASFRNFPVVALSTESRGLGVDDARERIEAVARAIQPHVAGALVYKKIDSSLRGCLGVEIDTLRAGLGFGCALVAPAYPAQGRLTAGGFHLIAQVPVGESEVARDPVTPVSESNLVRLLASQSGRPVGHITLDAVMAGAAALPACVASLRSEGTSLLAVDATTAGHLQALAEAVLSDTSILPCGSAGLAQALAEGICAGQRAVGADADPPVAPTASPTARQGGVLILCASQSRATAQQVEDVRTTGSASIWALDVRELAASPWCRMLEQTLDKARTSLVAGENVVLHATTGAGEVAPALILAGVSRVGQRLADTARQLILTGGDTAMAVCRALGATAMSIQGEVLPGVAAARLLFPSGHPLDGLPVITKAGSFGAPDTFTRLLAVT